MSYFNTSLLSQSQLKVGFIQDHKYVGSYRRRNLAADSEEIIVPSP